MSSKELISQKVEVMPEFAHLEQVQKSAQGGLVEKNIMLGELNTPSELQKSVQGNMAHKNIMLG